MSHFWNWLVHGEGYQLALGPVGCLVLVGAVFGVYRKHNCHVRRCWRLARHPIDGTDWLVCRKHHPEDHPKHYLPTPKDIHEAANDV